MKNTIKILISLIILLAGLSPVGSAFAINLSVEAEMDKDSRIAITRIDTANGRIAIKMLTERYIGRARDLVIWKWKDNVNLSELDGMHECGEMSKNDKALVLVEICEIKNKDWYYRFNDGHEIWLDVDKGVLQNNYKMDLNVMSVFGPFVKNSRIFKIFYGDCFDNRHYESGAECVREVIADEKVNKEEYFPYKNGIKLAGAYYERSYYWGDNRLDDERVDGFEIERFNYNNGEIEIKYYDEETVKNRIPKVEFSPEGMKETPGVYGGEGVDLLEKLGEEIRALEVFWSEDSARDVSDGKATKNILFKTSKVSDFRNDDKINFNLNNYKMNYTGVVYIIGEMGGGRRIYNKYSFKNCIGSDSFSLAGGNVCIKKYDRGRILFESELGGSYERGAAEEWELIDAQKNEKVNELEKRILDLKDEIASLSKKSFKEKEKKLKAELEEKLKAEKNTYEKKLLEEKKKFEILKNKLILERKNEKNEAADNKKRSKNTDNELKDGDSDKKSISNKENGSKKVNLLRNQKNSRGLIELGLGDLNLDKTIKELEREKKKIIDKNSKLLENNIKLSEQIKFERKLAKEKQNYLVKLEKNKLAELKEEIKEEDKKAENKSSNKNRIPVPNTSIDKRNIISDFTGLWVLVGVLLGFSGGILTKRMNFVNKNK